MEMTSLTRRLVTGSCALFALASAASALSVTFPIEMGSGEAEPRQIVMRGRSLKERFDRLELRYGTDIYRFGLYGDRSRAFRPDKTYFTHTFGGLVASRMKNGLDYEIKMNLRTVTDPTLSFRDDLHFTGFYATYGRKNVWNLRGGDLFPNLSRYTLNRFVKGLQGNYTRPLDSVRLNFTGVFARAERAREAATLRRVALGASATAESLKLVRSLPLWTAGYRFASASDQLGSVDNVRALSDLQVDVHSFEYGYRFPGGWSLAGENAWSGGTTNRRLLRDRNGYAWRTDVNWLRANPKPYEGILRLMPFALQFSWELNDPYFQSPLGVAAPNQMRWNVRTAHRFSPNADWTLSYLRLEDNVRNQLLLTNATRVTNGVLNMKPFLLFGSPSWTDRLPESVRNIRSKLEFRFSDRDASNGSVNNKIEDYLYTLQYANWGMNFTGEYQFQITDDDVTPRSDRRLQVYGLRVTRPLHWKAFDIRFFPQAGYQVSRDRFRLTGASSRLQTTTLGMGVNWEELGGMVNYTILDADRAPGNSDYLQNRVNMALTYKPYLYPGFQGTLSYGYLDNDEEAFNRSYRQTETRLTLSYTF